uniref:Uncharacterized protein n=1 Tax=Musca domestica TaxID=7370 RepID=A0A1I8MYM3_MUSDO
MAPSQMEHRQEQSMGHGYTHKKFNCGYSHKKLGMRLRQRDINDNKENIEQQQENTNKSFNSSTARNLFRPYALDDDMRRKRKTSCDSSSASSDEECSQQQFVSTPQSSPTNSFYQQQQQQILMSSPTASTTCPSPALSPNSYAERSQRQRAALYIRYMQQFQQQQQHPSLEATTLVHQQQQQAMMNNPSYYPMGYPNVIVASTPGFNGC